MPRLKLSTLEAHRKTFSDFVSFRAAQVGVTIYRIGELMQISESSIQKFKHDPDKMRVDDLLRMSNALNMDAATLLRVYSEGKEPWRQEAAT